jgi:hypothetical protein
MYGVLLGRGEFLFFWLGSHGMGWDGMGWGGICGMGYSIA